MTGAKLLVVDDYEVNLAVLVDLLSSRYSVTVANNGKTALQLAMDDPPDLILLDIMMPGMSGFEVCERLKAKRETEDIPVIFISAVDDLESKVTAFNIGGVDYVSKPFQVEELTARISTHLSLRSLQQQLENNNRELDRLVKLKNVELAEAYERLTIIDSTKTEFLELLAHELRTPASGVIGLAEMIFDDTISREDVTELKPLFQQSRDRMIETLDNALLLARIHVTGEEFVPQPVSLMALFQQIRGEVKAFAIKNKVQLELVPGHEFVLQGDKLLLKTALENLLKTGVKLATAGRVVVDIHAGETAVQLTVTCYGEPLAKEALSNFFDVFRSVRSCTYAEELGLNPAVAERIFSLYGGELTVANLETALGTIFNLQLLKYS